MKLESCVHFLLAKSQQKVYQSFKVKLKEYGVTPVQYAVLNILWDEDGRTSSDIANTIMLDNSTITGIIDRLMSGDFIVRKDDPLDRRKSYLFLTEKGKSLEVPLQKCVEELNVEVLSAFSEEEKDVFLRVLSKITFN